MLGSGGPVPNKPLTMLILSLSPDPEATEPKKLWCTPFSWENKGKGIHHRFEKKGIHHRASDLEKEKKEGLHGGGVYFFLPCPRV